MEKRKMMNFLTKAVQIEEVENSKTFDEFLDQFKLTPKLKHFILEWFLFEVLDY